MAVLPESTLAASEETNELPHSSPISITAKRTTPLVHLPAVPVARHNLAPSGPGSNHTRPSSTAHLSTPPDSPSCLPLSATSGKYLGSKHANTSMTPPPTPTSKSHDKTSSTLSCFPIPDKPASTELITFPYTTTDYVFLTDTKGRKKTLGEGAWSSVYLASPTLSHASEPSPQDMAMAGMSPPLTPVHSRNSSLASCTPPALRPRYAIKVPAMASAKKVLGAEAKILSYLSRFPDAHKHIVSFFGLDARTGSLVLEAVDDTLESWIANELNTLSEPCRAAELARIFPGIALALINSLEWMQDKDCIQADIKPSNILIQTSMTALPKAVYTDFSSALVTKPGASVNAAASVIGAGTWDYLDPKLLSSTAPAQLSPCTDLWSLAITLLYLVIGRSPYEAFKANKYQQREMIKSGSPLQCLAHDEMGAENVKRLGALSKELGLDVHLWFSMVLAKDQSKRAGLAEWRGTLVAGAQR